jgi:hypothetical protein
MPASYLANKIKADDQWDRKYQCTCGFSEERRVTISGSGKLLLEAVAAEKVEATISGSGDIKVNVSQSLDATISGSGFCLFIAGTP